VICVANCRVIWSSKLQGDIATSTMEAKYSALSMAMRELLPFSELLLTLAPSIGIVLLLPLPHCHCNRPIAIHRSIIAASLPHCRCRCPYKQRHHEQQSKQERLLSRHTPWQDTLQEIQKRLLISWQAFQSCKFCCSGRCGAVQSLCQHDTQSNWWCWTEGILILGSHSQKVLSFVETRQPIRSTAG
jgi:hypothetical protein